MPTLLVPDSLTWDLSNLPLEIARFPARGPVPESAKEADALLVWGVRREVFGPLLLEMPNLRWVQTLSAGVEGLMQPDLPERVVVCNGRGLHDVPVAEHAVALLLSAVRGLHRFRDAQRERRWDSRAYWSAVEGGNRLATLEGARVLILGMGSIGLAIARALAPFEAVVEGVAQSAGERGGVRTHALSNLERLLPATDALVLVLPETRETKGILSCERLALLPSHAWVVNVGRGSAVDEEALADALEAGRLGGAALDVFAAEPLPENSRLWNLENVIVSPHVAGGGPRFNDKARDLLRRNALHFARGEPLENVVDRDKGY